MLILLTAKIESPEFALEGEERAGEKSWLPEDGDGIGGWGCLLVPMSYQLSISPCNISLRRTLFIFLDLAATTEETISILSVYFFYFVPYISHLT